MNFLGHLYFSGTDKELMHANLYGDFVRGSKLDHYPDIIQKGIVLHRQIDFYIDNHAAVKKLKHALMHELPKIGPVAIDLFFDHLLAKNWSAFHQDDYGAYLRDFYAHNTIHYNHYPTTFMEFMEKLRLHQWMNHYPTKFGLEKSCEGVSKRISFETNLAQAPVIFDQRESEIKDAFLRYMEDAQKEFLMQ